MLPFSLPQGQMQGLIAYPEDAFGAAAGDFVDLQSKKYKAVISLQNSNVIKTKLVQFGICLFIHLLSGQERVSVLQSR